MGQLDSFVIVAGLSHMFGVGWLLVDLEWPWLGLECFLFQSLTLQQTSLYLLT